MILLLAFFNFSFKLSIILCNSITVTSLFILALFLIFLARSPNLNVLNVSLSLNTLGEHVIIKHVFELPPKDSCKTLVNLLSL